MLFGKEHVDRYVATNGEEGHNWVRGAPVLILTTTGRRSGETRSTRLIYGRSGADYLVVGSKGRAVPRPAWCLTLTAIPDVSVQVAVPADSRGRISTRETALQTLNRRRDPHASVCVLSDRFFGEWHTVDGPVEIVSLPEAMEPLVDYYRRAVGEHPDWDDYRAA